MILRKITCVEGIAEIRLTAMSKGSKALAGRVKLETSTTPGLIEGRLHAPGPKGDVQCFQVRLHDPRRTTQTFERIEEVLRAAGALA